MDPTRKARMKGLQQKKHGRHHPHSHPAQPSMTALKSQIRDIKRLLAKNTNLPADVTQEKERQLTALEFDLKEAVERAANDEIARKHAQKYKFVRFVGWSITLAEQSIRAWWLYLRNDG